MKEKKKTESKQKNNLEQVVSGVEEKTKKAKTTVSRKKREVQKIDSVEKPKKTEISRSAETQVVSKEKPKKSKPRKKVVPEVIQKKDEQPVQKKKVVRPITRKKKAEPVKEEVKPVTTIIPPSIPVTVVTKQEKAVEKPEPEKKKAEPVPVRPKVKINELVTVGQLAEKMNIKPAEMIKKMMTLGSLATINQRLALDTATLIANEFGFDIEFVLLYGEETIVEEKEDKTKLVPRPPVVTIMGHVDHGKTTLLDVIRKSKLAEKEVGNITQHIGAYKVITNRGEIVFLDTPGHEAFTAMRARGSQVTDLVILVVAADDGVMPQTVEAIDHAKAAGVPIIVAINKIDLPTANQQKIKEELSKLGLQPEEWGGKTIFVEVSAKKQINLDQLLEMISLEAELLELKANPDCAAQGIAVEAKLDTRRGPVATILVTKGTLKLGDSFISGLTYGKVRALIDDRGHKLSFAGPATPVEVLGFNFTPQLGDRFSVVTDDREARHIADRRLEIQRAERLSKKRVSLEDFHNQLKEGKIKELKIILKTDVRGSLEVLKDSLERFAHPEVSLKVIHSGIGAIRQSDCLLAEASDAVIIGFNIHPEPAVQEFAKTEGVDIRCYQLIFEVLDDLKAAVEGLLEPKIKEVVTGKVEVREVFKVSKVGFIAGCFVTEGKVKRGDRAKVHRDKNIIYDGKIVSLKRFKEDVKEVDRGYECGIGLDNFQELRKGDLLEIYIQEKIKQRV